MPKNTIDRCLAILVPCWNRRPELPNWLPQGNLLNIGAESGPALKLRLVWILLAEHLGRFGSAVFENARIFFGVDRETMLAISNVEFTARRVKNKL
jgi:hypothetical protein